MVKRRIRILGKRRNRSWFARLLDKDDTAYALSSMVILIIMIFACLLLGVCIYAIGVEAWYTHTVSSDINGWSLYISAVTALISTACGLKWGINYTDRKFPAQEEIIYDDNNDNNIKEENIIKEDVKEDIPDEE